MITFDLKVYLGDGVFVQRDSLGRVILSTEDGMSITNQIYLEGEVLAAFDAWRQGRNRMAESEPVWIVYDGRAIFGDTDDAGVLESFGYPDVKTDYEARCAARKTWKGVEFALYRYDLINGEAHNERLLLAKQI